MNPGLSGHWRTMYVCMYVCTYVCVTFIINLFFSNFKNFKVNTPPTSLLLYLI